MKVYYLNWENEALRNNYDVVMRTLRGANKGDNINLSLYRSHDYSFLDSCNNLEEVFCELNKDDRLNSKEERSLCVGDMVLFEGEYYCVNPIGFEKVVAI